MSVQLAATYRFVALHCLMKWSIFQDGLEVKLSIPDAELFSKDGLEKTLQVTDLTTFFFYGFVPVPQLHLIHCLDYSSLV